MNEVKRMAGEPGYGIAPSGFRLPPGTRPGRVRLQVADLERALAFYQQVLGLRVLERSGPEATLGAQAGGPPLVELHERPGAASVPRRGRLGLYHYAILLPDRGALARFASHLHAVGVRPGASDHWVSEALYLHDPDGLGIEVYADRPRSAWQHRGRELVMTTEPLDLARLEDEAAGEQWAGMPAAATIGHVHLHVGDLEHAAAFYHEALGLDLTVWSYPGALFLSAGGYHHHLGVNTWAAGAGPADEKEARLLEWELLIPSEADLDRALDNLTAAGHQATPGPEGAVARDPWGTVVELRHPRPR